MGTFYKKGDILSPSGFVKIDETFRRGKIDTKNRKNGLCTWCGIVVKLPKRNWCSKDCFNKYDLTQPSTLKKLVKKRDKGVCAICFNKHSKKSEIDMDHTIPICEGGHPFDLSNLRTLCKLCHKKETKKLNERRHGKNL